ncbi:sensor histidine kinase [Streptomyces sp. 3MP-14]|uniref:histidine kinase n=1 Tax=Streptomyces mimosae TaxID=2586635 RepID=A0A5N6ALU8_9ACTN|nr:sensor histidine kinase [Streptomyces mimosae]KAB8178565.1 sensor histidine kinase [Streptomyces sp. 3MP-14]
MADDERVSVVVSAVRRRLPEVPSRLGPFGLDALLALALALTCGAIALLLPHDGRAVDGLALALLVGVTVPLAWRRRAPLGALLVSLAFTAAYHRLDYQHVAPFAATAVGAYTVAAVGPRRRTLVLAGGVLLVVVFVWYGNGGGPALKLLRISGWLLCILAVGETVRLHRRLLAAARERAERAERTREEEAARRVAEERLRIARDLHDLLAHSITVIGVRASVAAHLLSVERGARVDLPTVAATLDGIADVCRDARAELRYTLRGLRGDEPEPAGPPPGVAGIPDLVRAAEGAGASVELTVEPDLGPLPGLVGAAAYRIVQEALTNAVHHAGPGARIAVALRRADDALRLTVADGGPSPGSRPARAPGSGLGLAGMRERARGVGGRLTAGPRPSGGPGFEVAAELPLKGSSL